MIGIGAEILSQAKCFEMPVYLVHREAYQENCKALKKFPMSNLLEWAQFIWDLVYMNPDDQEFNQEIYDFIGLDIYGINVEYFKEFVFARPANIEDAIFGIGHIFYHEAENTNNKNFIQLLDRDGAPLEYAVYLFDEMYLNENPGIASYLLTEDFRMPGTNKANHSAGQGLHFYFDNHWFTSCLSMHEPGFYIPGIGLNDLPLYLSKAKPVDREWPPELLFLRALSLDSTGQLNSFEQMIQDYLQYDGSFWEHFLLSYEGTERAFFLGHDVLSIQEQLRIKYQAFNHYRPFEENHGLHKVDFKSSVFNAVVLTANFGSDTNPHYVYDRWIFFESSWVQEYPDLASSIDHYFSRWDCLQ